MTNARRLYTLARWESVAWHTMYETSEINSTGKGGWPAAPGKDGQFGAFVESQRCTKQDRNAPPPSDRSL
jgi:hypothetical protein